MSLGFFREPDRFNPRISTRFHRGQRGAPGRYETKQAHYRLSVLLWRGITVPLAVAKMRQGFCVAFLAFEQSGAPGGSAKPSSCCVKIAAWREKAEDWRAIANLEADRGLDCWRRTVQKLKRRRGL
jgi:hypothetical protein